MYFSFCQNTTDMRVMKDENEGITRKQGRKQYLDSYSKLNFQICWGRQPTTGNVCLSPSSLYLSPVMHELQSMLYIMTNEFLLSSCYISAYSRGISLQSPYLVLILISLRFPYLCCCAQCEMLQMNVH